MVFVILLLVTTPVLVLRKFLSTIVFLFYALYPGLHREIILLFKQHVFFAATLFSNAQGLYAMNGCSLDFPGVKWHVRIPVSSASVHPPGSWISGLSHSGLSGFLQNQSSLTLYLFCCNEFSYLVTSGAW